MDFYTLVENMRKSQKEYFKAKTYTAAKQELLEKSKKLEKEVDQAIIEHHQILAAEYMAAQPDLFPVDN